jgi:hypothetical protein
MAQAVFEHGQLKAGAVASPRDPLAHQAQASVNWSSRWKLTALDPALPDGTFVTVNLGVYFGGSLTAGAWGGGYARASAAGRLSASSSTGQAAYSGTAALATDPDTGLPVPAVDGQWQSALLPSEVPLTFALSHNAMLALPAALGDCLVLDASLDTFVEALGWTPDPDAVVIPNPLWGHAAADMMDTARVAFLGGTDARGNPVNLKFAPMLIPEPGCWAGCFAVGLLGWAFQRRLRHRG